MPRFKIFSAPFNFNDIFTEFMVGIVIGSGIFFTTGIMAKSIPSAPLIFLPWMVGGLLALNGIILTALGIPVYYYWKGKKQNAT